MTTTVTMTADARPGGDEEPSATVQLRQWRHHRLATHLTVLALLLGSIGSILMGAQGHQRTLLAGGVVLALVALLLVVLTTEFDSTTLLIGSSFVLLLIPSRLVIGALGGAGTPAAVLGMFGGWLWLLGVLVPAVGSAKGRQPVRGAVIFYFLAVVASYVVASMRGLDPVEARAADRGIFVAASTVAFALVAADGIRTRARLEQLLRAVVVAGSGLALIGILQFTISFDVASMIRIPGLTVEESKYEAITSRAEFNRVAGTTYHPIEFSAVLTMLLPLALHFTFSSPPGRRRRWWLAVGIIAAAIPMSVSRTGTVGLVALALILFPTWTGARRRQALLAGVAFAVVMKALVPGLLGTIRALFLSLGVDPSVTNRRIDYGYVTSFITERPIFGRGFGTFLPSRYDFLDNQFLLSLVETGVVGLVALLGVFAIGVGCLRGARRRSEHPATRDLAQSLLAGLVVALITCGTFDFLSFPTARILAFLLVGCAGALWRMERQGAATGKGQDEMATTATAHSPAAAAVPRQEEVLT